MLGIPSNSPKTTSPFCPLTPVEGGNPGMDLYSTVIVLMRVWDNPERPDPHAIPILGGWKFWAFSSAKRYLLAER